MIMKRTPYRMALAGLTALVVIAGSACNQPKGASPDTTAGKGSLDSTTLAPPPPQAPPPAAAVDTTPSQPVVTHIATISTSAGDMEVELYGNDAPKAVKNFVELVKQKFYDGLAFHRVVQGFVIQTGDPMSKDESKRSIWGQGGVSTYGQPFEDELNPNSPSGRRGYVEGTLAMANSGPNTNTSQFYIVLTTAGAAHLPYSYTIFGFVRKGMDAAHKIEQTGATSELPEHPATIKTIRIREVPPATASAAKTGADTAAHK
ncbi:MAG: peptidyl-prolyl cis-trans isomerase, peptidylprolyl isomerase [Chlorobi bacterium]|nr:peptidyl-prolyl cis-trans isomerase, peptidylprolyl isomerase [Chlorobiota bacterium]